MAQEKDNKTEEPTGYRLNQAKKEGNIPRSREIGEGLALMAMTLSMVYFLPFSGKRVIAIFRYYFSLTAEKGLSDTSFLSALTNAGAFYVGLLLPLFILFISLAFFASAAQGSINIHLKRVQFKADKLNFFTGIKRVLFSKATAVELLKNFLKLIVIGWIAYGIIDNELPTILGLPGLPLMDILRKLGSLLFSLSFKTALFILSLSLLDYLYQKFEFRQNLKMSKQEVRDEYKMNEGDPRIKGKIRNVQYSYAMKRMIQEVPKADVIITNPTHYAVALLYDRKSMTAPQLLAKGADLVAQRIREKGKEHNVPIVENPPLARRIYGDVEVGDSIPLDLFQAVAEVLAYVYKLKNRSL